MRNVSEDQSCQHCPDLPKDHDRRMNRNERSLLNCTQATGLPCRCRRLSGKCVQCRRDVTVTNGENADFLPHDKGRLTGYRCVRCR